jgi:hypothetical protein
LEGPNRATRGANYLRYIHAIAPTSSARQRRIVVPGVDHDSDAIFASPLARTVLFGLNTTADTAASAVGGAVSGTANGALNHATGALNRTTNSLTGGSGVGR